MKNNLKEFIITGGLVLTAILLLNPFHFWMPNVLVICMLATALVLFSLFASFVIREHPGDEREKQHQSLAGRNAFLAGSGILMVGIIIQGYTHTVNPWLVFALVGMIITKFMTRIWADRHL